MARTKYIKIKANEDEQERWRLMAAKRGKPLGAIIRQYLDDLDGYVPQKKEGLTLQRSFMPDEPTVAPKAPAKKSKMVSLWCRFPRDIRREKWWLFGCYQSEGVAQEVVRKKSHQTFWGDCDWFVGEKPKS